MADFQSLQHITATGHEGFEEEDDEVGVGIQTTVEECIADFRRRILTMMRMATAIEMIQVFLKRSMLSKLEHLPNLMFPFHVRL